MAPYTHSFRSITSNPSNPTSPTLPTSAISSQSASSSSGTGEIISNILFGALASIIGLVTIWQAHRAWQLWRTHHTRSGGEESTIPAATAIGDLELPTRINTSSPTLDGPLPAPSTVTHALAGLPTPSDAHGNASTLRHSMVDDRQASHSPRPLLSPNAGDDPVEGAGGTRYSRDPEDWSG